MAGALHATLYFALDSKQKTAGPNAGPVPPQEVEVDWLPETPEDSALVHESSEPRLEPPRSEPKVRARSGQPSLRATGDTDTEEGTPTAEPGPEAVAEASAPAGSGTASPQRPIDLGLDGRIFAREALRQQRTSQPKLSTQLDRNLANGLAAGDVARGLTRGGPAVSALRLSTREIGPTRGAAVVEISVNAEGATTGVRLVGGGSEWEAMLRKLRERLKAQVFRVPAGATGLRLTLSVQAKVQRASGKEVGSSAIGAEVSPLEITGDFDVSDLSSSVQRIVSARVITEEIL